MRQDGVRSPGGGLAGRNFSFFRTPSMMALSGLKRLSLRARTDEGEI